MILEPDHRRRGQSLNRDRRRSEHRAARDRTGVNSDRTFTEHRPHRERIRTDDRTVKIIGAEKVVVAYAAFSMSLQPRRPIGYAKRKALAYAADIVRLHSSGHSMSAIQEALQDVGVQVSLSTIRREVIKGASAAAPTGMAAGSISAPRSGPAGAAHRQPAAAPPASPPQTAALPTALPGKAVAEEFMRGRPTNTLFLKEPPP